MLFQIAGVTKKLNTIVTEGVSNNRYFLKFGILLQDFNDFLTTSFCCQGNVSFEIKWNDFF